MLNTDACQARVKSGCIVFSSPFENHFVLHHAVSAPHTECSSTNPAEQTGAAFPRAHWVLNPFVSVCLLLYLNIWEQPQFMHDFGYVVLSLDTNVSRRITLYIDT